MAPDYGTHAAVARNWSFPLIYLRNLILFKLLCVKSNEWDSVSTKSYQKSVKCTRGVTLHFARLLGQIQLVLMRARQLMITGKTINILFSYTLNNVRRSSNLLISRSLPLNIINIITKGVKDPRATSFVDALECLNLLHLREIPIRLQSSLRRYLRWSI